MSNWQIDFLKNRIQIGGEGIENMLMNIVLKYIYIYEKTPSKLEFAKMKRYGML
jgi:hypothetical protein